MASTTIPQLNALTPDCQAVRDLRELIWLEQIKLGALNDVVRFVFNVRTGKKMGFLGELDDIGRAEELCDHDWRATPMDASEKEWRLGVLAVYEYLCATDFEETVGEYAINYGNNEGDLIGTDIVDVVVRPALERAILKMYWRVYWFADTEAEHVSDGGVITNTKDLTLLTMADGFFKRLFTAIPTGAANHVEIAANQEATYAEQMAAIKVDGVAQDIFDALTYDRPLEMAGVEGAEILCTESLALALARDIKRNNKGSELQWQSLFGGFMKATEYNGVTIVSIPYWDRFIYEWENDGTKAFNPHRAVYTFRDNLLAGMATNEQNFDLTVWYDQKDEHVYMKHRNHVGTLIGDERLIQFAY